MSITAKKYINYCFTDTKIANLLIGCIDNRAIRKQWRNADVLARFLVDTVANAYECENSTTFADNGFDDMEDAINSYIMANLDDWDQEKFLASSFGKRTVKEIADRLSEVAFNNAAFEAKQKMTMTADQKAALAEGVDQFRETQCEAFLAYWRETCDVTMTLLTANRTWCQMRDEASRWNDEIDVVLAHAVNTGIRPVRQDGDTVMAIQTAQRLFDQQVLNAQREKIRSGAWVDEASSIREELESGVHCPQLAQDTEETRFTAHAMNRTINLYLWNGVNAFHKQCEEYGYTPDVWHELRRIARRVQKTPQFILRRWANIGANSFGGVIGECDDLMEALDNAGHHQLAEKVGYMYDAVKETTTTHKGERRNWVNNLQGMANRL